MYCVSGVCVIVHMSVCECARMVCVCVGGVENGFQALPMLAALLLSYISGFLFTFYFETQFCC